MKWNWVNISRSGGQVADKRKWKWKEGKYLQQQQLFTQATLQFCCRYSCLLPFPKVEVGPTTVHEQTDSL